MNLTKQGYNFFLILGLMLLIGAVSAHNAWATSPSFPIGLKQIEKSPVGAPTTPIVLKLQPAFFWSALGLELDIVLGNRLVVGLELIGKLGSIDGQKNTNQVRQEDYLKSGGLAGTYFRYYFLTKKKEKAPIGAYIQLGGGYNNMIYFDGNTRPFTLHNRWKKIDNVQSSELYEKPQPYYGNLGVGYQLVIIPDKIVGNILLGTQANFDSENQFFLSVYLSPSFGIHF